MFIADCRGDYEAVAGGAADQIMGATGRVGDRLLRVIVSVNTAATGNCSIKDGNGSAIPLTPVNTPIGCYSFELNIVALATTTPGWKITTGAGATAIGIGDFT